MNETPGAADPTAYPSSVLSKARLLLTAFDVANPTLGLAEMGRRSGVAKATAYRLAQELVHLGFLDRVGEGYQLGWRVFELGQLVPGPANLRHIARPALMDLHAATRAVVHLAVRQGHYTMHLERLSGRRDPRIHAAVGTRAPMWFSASGKLFMAYSADLEDLLAVMRHSGVVPPTRHSIRTVEQLRGELAVVRGRRWAFEHEEYLDGYKTYAVPITLGGPEHVVAAVSSTLDVRRTDDQMITRALWATTGDITRSLQRSTAPVSPDKRLTPRRAIS